MKGVVLLSGGIDSSTNLALAVNECGAANVIALTMFYGQKHEKELLSAKAVAEHFGVKHIIRDLSSVFEFDSNPLLGKSDKEIPQGSYAEQQREANGMSLTYVPFRNGLFLSYATAIAYSLSADVIYYGAHADDAAGNAYPDCTQDFYKAMGDAIDIGTGERIEMHAPFITMNKAEIVKLGLEVGTPYHLTWSCYEGKEFACGKCGTCIDRQEAFRKNGVVDPIPYLG